MAYDEALADRIRTALATRDVTEKKMFGGIAFLLGGNMCVGVIRDDLIVRTFPEDGVAYLEEEHVREFDLTGRTMTGWILVGPGATTDDDGLRTWVGRGVAFAETLPPKQR
jgi:TfoX/Sxy family transcriptional regulator of competence genes